MSMNRPKWTFKMEGADTTDLWKELIGRTSRGYSKLAANQQAYQKQAQQVLGGVSGLPVMQAPLPMQGPPGPPSSMASTYAPQFFGGAYSNMDKDAMPVQGPGAPAASYAPSAPGAATSGIPDNLWSSNIYSGQYAENGPPTAAGPSMAGAAVPYEIRRMQEVAAGQGLGGAPTTAKGMAGGGAAGPVAGPNDAWAQENGVDMNWWNQFKATPHPLGDQMLTGVDPVQYYMQSAGGSREAALARALKDAQWGAKFASTYGRPPTVDDWKYQWFTGNRQNQGANTVAEQNAYQAGLAGQYGVSPKPIVRK